MRSILFAAAVVAGFSAPALAHDFTLGDLSIGHPYAIATPPRARTGAGYLTITNAGTAADRLLEVRADFPDVQLHTTEVDAAGVARMRELEAVEIPAGETVVFEPRGMHVMFVGLAAPLEAGATIPAVLVFEQAGEVEVVFNVEERGEQAPGHDGMDHGHGGHGGHGAMAPAGGAAETVIPAMLRETVAPFGRFEGTVPIGADGAHPPAGH
jgi:copper(I)-binding protein